MTGSDHPDDPKDWTRNVSFEGETIQFSMVTPVLEGRTVLRQWREDHVRRSEETVELWEHVISRYPSSLRDELWAVYEQVCIAALDCARHDVALECIQALQKQFPRSNRVLKLQAMLFEARERFDNALSMYDKLITADPTNQSYRKRKIAILKCQGARAEAIRELNDYLAVFLNDSEAWAELSQLYLTEGDYAKAAHAMEELVLSQPHNALYMNRLAEIKYTQGGLENTEVAKAYFAQAERTNPSCCRSLYGLLMTSIWLAQKATGVKRKEFVQCGQEAADRLMERYRENKGEQRGSSKQLAIAFEAQLKTIRTLRDQLTQ